MSPQPERESSKDLITPEKSSGRKSVKKLKPNNSVASLKRRLKRSSLPLSTGRPVSNAIKKTEASDGTDMQAIIDKFNQAKEFSALKTERLQTEVLSSKPNIEVNQTHKIQNRHNQINVKNKQSSIPFSKLRQPRYIQYNRFGTTKDQASSETKLLKGD